MKRLFSAWLIALLPLLQLASAADDSVDSLKAENESLRAQLAQLNLERVYDQRVCTQLDLMQIRVASFLAQQKAEKTKEKNAKAPVTPSDGQ